MAPYQTLALSHDGDIALLTLNRPEKRNAISPEMMAELHLALNQLESESTRAIILTGAGKSFCAGLDLSELKKSAETTAAGQGRDAPSSTGIEGSKRIADLFRHIYTFPKPLIAAVNGHAIAGGCGLATLCDITLAVPAAKFGYPEVRIGFMPAFVSIFLIRQIGEKRARDLLLTGRLVAAEEAVRLGLVNEVSSPEQLLDRAKQIAAEFIAASPTSVAFTKRFLAGLVEAEVAGAMARAAEASASIRTTGDFKEGLSAFLEKRPPRWRGR